MKILHCKKWRPVPFGDLFVLRSRVDAYAVQIVGTTTCGFCRQKLMAWLGSDAAGLNPSAVFMIKQRDHEKWLQRLEPNSPKYDVLARGSANSDSASRLKILAGDYTLFISSDTGDIWEKHLQRLQDIF